MKHGKYSNFVRRLLVLTRENHLLLDRISTQTGEIKLPAMDHEIASQCVMSDFVTIRVYEERTDTLGQFTLDRDQAFDMTKTIADHTHGGKYDRIVEQLQREFSAP